MHFAEGVSELFWDHIGMAGPHWCLL